MNLLKKGITNDLSEKWRVQNNEKVDVYYNLNASGQLYQLR